MRLNIDIIRRCELKFSKKWPFIKRKMKRGFRKLKNLLSTDDLKRSDLEKIFLLSDDIKKNQQKYSDCLKGKIISTLFYEPSTRTRLSFESAIIRLGASVISTENARENSSVWKGETVEDTVQTLSGYCDAIVIRNGDVNSINKAATVATVPLVNAGNGSAEHPTQAILDLYTIREYKGGIDGISIVIMGDAKHGRTIHSLIKLLAIYKNITIYDFSIDGLCLPQEYITLLKQNNINYHYCFTIDDVPSDVDIIYQTRLQKERLQKNILYDNQFCIDKTTLNKFSKNTFIMHPLPRGKEIHPSVDSDARAIYFQQAHNGVVTRMAILLTVINNFYK